MPDDTRWYPRLGRRIHAVMIDGAIVVAGWLAVFLLLGPLQPDPRIMIALIVGVFLIEPVLVATTKGSIGHHLLRIQVVDTGSEGRIGLLRAVARMLLRGMFGLFSLFFIHTTSEYRALHDILTRTVVLLRDPSAMAPRDVRTRQVLEHAQYEYPSLLRRGLIIVCYAVPAFLVIGIAAALSLSDSCLAGYRCSAVENAVVWWARFVIVVSIGVLMVAGVRGRLYGARRVLRFGTDE